MKRNQDKRVSLKRVADLSDQNKKDLLIKVAELCKKRVFSQADIIRHAIEHFEWKNNKKTKGTLSKYLKEPNTKYNNVPDQYFAAMLDLLDNKNIDLPFNISDVPNISDIEDALSFFMEVRGSEDIQTKKQLHGSYWMYAPSITQPGCIVKSLLNISEGSGGSLNVEEILYYPVKGCEKNYTLVFKGFGVCIDGHAILLLKDENNNLLPKFFMLSPKNKNTLGECIRLSGGCMLINRETDSPKIIQRKVSCYRIVGAFPNDKHTLIEKHGLGIHNKNTEDKRIQGLFEEFEPHKIGQVISV